MIPRGSIDFTSANLDQVLTIYAELVGYGSERIQKDPKIQMLYSQAAAMTNFLVYYQGGRYRDALVAYLVDVYTGKDTPHTLSQRTGCRYAEPACSRSSPASSRPHHHGRNPR